MLGTAWKNIFSGSKAKTDNNDEKELQPSDDNDETMDEQSESKKLIKFNEMLAIAKNKNAATHTLVKKVVANMIVSIVNAVQNYGRRMNIVEDYGTMICTVICTNRNMSNMNNE